MKILIFLCVLVISIEAIFFGGGSCGCCSGGGGGTCGAQHSCDTCPQKYIVVRVSCRRGGGGCSSGGYSSGGYATGGSGGYATGGSGGYVSGPTQVYPVRPGGSYQAPAAPVPAPIAPGPVPPPPRYGIHENYVPAGAPVPQVSYSPAVPAPVPVPAQAPVQFQTYQATSPAAPAPQVSYSPAAAAPAAPPVLAVPAPAPAPVAVQTLAPPPPPPSAPAAPAPVNQNYDSQAPPPPPPNPSVAAPAVPEEEDIVYEDQGAEGAPADEGDIYEEIVDEGDIKKLKFKAKARASKISPNLIDLKCNSNVLRTIITQNIVAKDPNESKRRIHKSANEQIKSMDGRVIDVICAPVKFSYRIATDLFCEQTKDEITCFAYQQFS